MPERQKDSWNRDDQQRAGRPPGAATTPEGASGSALTNKTATDPNTGAPINKAPAPNQAEADETDGAPT